MTGESGVEGEQGGWGRKASRPTGQAHSSYWSHVPHLPLPGNRTSHSPFLCRRQRFKIVVNLVL